MIINSEKGKKINQLNPLLGEIISNNLIIVGDASTGVMYKSDFGSFARFIMDTMQRGTNDSVTFSQNFGITIPANTLLRDIVIVPTIESITMCIGITNGGQEIMPITEIPVGGGADNPFGLNKWFGEDTQLYINGITSETYFKFFME